MEHIEQCMIMYDKLKHRRIWWQRQYGNIEVKPEQHKKYYRNYFKAVLYKHELCICPDGDVLNRRKEDGLIWKELLFTDPLWVVGELSFYTGTRKNRKMYKNIPIRY